MEKIFFLSKKQVLRIHDYSISKHGGSPGIRDKGLLESALEMPRSGFGDVYFHESLFDKASAYLFHICKNHPFLDGNKRTALGCSEIFLEINGYILSGKYQSELYDLVINVASRKITSKEEISKTLENMSEKK